MRSNNTELQRFAANRSAAFFGSIAVNRCCALLLFSAKIIKTVYSWNVKKIR